MQELRHGLLAAAGRRAGAGTSKACGVCVWSCELQTKCKLRSMSFVLSCLVLYAPRAGRMLREWRRARGAGAGGAGGRGGANTQGLGLVTSWIFTAPQFYRDRIENLRCTAQVIRAT
jgi:hypothetical protein